jgi:serine/threonine-protein kinase
VPGVDGARWLETGAVVGAYTIDRLIGTGGMAEVYRAHDTRLGRDVAIKVLPQAFTADPERVARIEREARLLAALNHPNIAHIYDVEKSPGTYALVMELVEGPTLADRIARGPIPVDEALGISKQVAEALEAAHEQGIIHRDLKPANVKVRLDGTVKVLDFGLAKALEPMPAGGIDPTASPTVTSPAMMTGVGVLLGTAAYMSPEQARGLPVDKRTDIWAFGCVLYEMLAGRHVFEGEDVAEILGAVLKTEPDWKRLPRNVPLSVQRLLRLCLEKNPRNRRSDASDVRIDIEHALKEAESAATPSASVPRRGGLAWIAAAIIACSALTGFATWWAVQPAAPRVVRTAIPAAGPATLGVHGRDRDLVITPDGRRIIYRGTANEVFVRALDQEQPTVLTDLAVPRGLFASPDGQWVGFFDTITQLKKVAITGGPAVLITVADADPRGATWGADNTLVYATLNRLTGLLRVPAVGGTPTVLTKPDQRRGEDHFWPEFLPGGEAILFSIMPAETTGESQIAVLDLATGTSKVVLRGGSHATYVPTGHLVYGVNGTVRAVPFDLNRLEVVGTPVPVIDDVVMTSTGAVDLSVALDGTLAYATGRTINADARILVWVDRRGREEPIAAPARSYGYPRLAPDGRRVAIELDNQIWMYDLVRATLTRSTFEGSINNNPTWTPDGRRIAFFSTKEGPQNVFWQMSDGSGGLERLTSSQNTQVPKSFSADGTLLAFHEISLATRRDVWVLSMTDRKPRPFLQTPAIEGAPSFSPDGRWIGYVSDESGRPEIYVQPFPGPGGKWQVSTGGGTEPVWSSDGREIFYRNGRRMMAVPVTASSGFSPGTPVPLFEGDYEVSAFPLTGVAYDVTRDRQRFLMVKATAAAQAAPAQINVVQNWDQELKRLVPTR